MRCWWSRPGGTIPRGTTPVLRENLIHLAVVDFLASAAGPWDPNLMAPSGLPGLRCLDRSRASLAAENAFKRQNAMLAV
jgi:hypothetical protein